MVPVIQINSILTTPKHSNDDSHNHCSFFFIKASIYAKEIFLVTKTWLCLPFFAVFTAKFQLGITHKQDNL